MMIKIAGIVMIATFAFLILKKDRPEYAFVLETAVVIFLLMTVIPYLTHIIQSLSDLMQELQFAREYISVLLKCAAYAVVAKLLHDFCKDAGENALASKLEFAGKILIMLTAMPLFTAVFELIGELLEKYL